MGFLETRLHRWLKIADRQDCGGPPDSPTAAQDVAAQLREAHKRIKSSAWMPRAALIR
ncbi:hypothetical protein MMMB2_1699 [Mycobacterium marinum MB2]|nr:hypothetical protein MMMB2_1699 [Mycobacterium marinum MB2]